MTVPLNDRASRGDVANTVEAIFVISRHVPRSRSFWSHLDWHVLLLHRYMGDISTLRLRVTKRVTK
jgi:hypothetical protein